MTRQARVSIVYLLTCTPFDISTSITDILYVSPTAGVGHILSKPAVIVHAVLVFGKNMPICASV